MFFVFGRSYLIGRAISIAPWQLTMKLSRNGLEAQHSFEAT